jgi:hypothetical protein
LLSALLERSPAAGERSGTNIQTCYSAVVVIHFYICIGEVSLEERIGRKEKYVERNAYIQNQTVRLQGKKKKKERKPSAISVTVLPSLGKSEQSRYCEIRKISIKHGTEI